jgi:hypothetical protein
MMIHKIVVLFFCFLCGQLAGMGLSAPIPDENKIRIVLLGSSGAGKSSIIRAFCNFANKIKWQQHPKLFPISTDFQPCNVEKYSQRSCEVFTRNQLESVTMEPSEYEFNGAGFVIQMIDTPGASDTRGILKDGENSAMIAEFLRGIGSIHAFCVVIPGTLNRESDAKYWMNQILTLIPRDAANRIFILISHSTNGGKNARNIAENVGLPLNQTFEFDNFALSLAGHVDISDVNLKVSYLEEISEDDNLYVDVKRELAEKIKDSWLKSNREFFRLMTAAKNLGRYSTSPIREIGIKIRDIQQKTLLAQEHQMLSARHEIHLLAALDGLKVAFEIYGDFSTQKLIEELQSRRANAQQKLIAMQNSVAELYLELGELSLGSPSAATLQQYDFYIIREKDPTKKAKLNLERDFHAKIVDIYHCRRGASIIQFQ